APRSTRLGLAGSLNTETLMIRGRCHCGAVNWTFDNQPDTATACNCTVCRRYGVLWIYGWENEDVTIAGPTTAYVREDFDLIEFHFCPTCGNVAAWRMCEPEDNRRRIAVNARLAEPET